MHTYALLAATIASLTESQFALLYGAFASGTGVSYMMRWSARSKMRSGEELTDGEKASIWLSDGLRGGNDIAMHERMLEMQKENEALREKVDKDDSGDSDDSANDTDEPEPDAQEAS